MMKMMMTEKSVQEVFKSDDADVGDADAPSTDKLMGRRVSFPVDELLVTGYVEPPNPWEKAVGATTSDLVDAYTTACDKNQVNPLAKVVHQLEVIDDFTVRYERLDLQDEILGPRQVEALEEVFKMMQFEYLDLENASLDDESAAAIFDMVEYYESAKRINISRNRLISSRVWQACCHMIKRTRCLEELSACSMIVDESISTLLARTLRGNLRLISLRLEDCSLTGRPLCTLLASLRVNSTLQEMYLANNKMNSDDAIHIANFLRKNCTVKLLDLSDNQLEDRGIQLLVAGLCDQFDGEAGFVVNLKLANNRLTSISMTHMAQALGVMCPLEILDLSRNELLNEGIHNMKEALFENHSLQRLMLNGCHITCEGAVAIAEVMANNPVMDTLEMNDNQVGLGGLMALAHSAKVNTKITSLQLDDADKLLPPDYNKNDLKEHAKLLEEISSYCHRNRAEAIKNENADNPSADVPMDAPKGPLARLLSLWARNPAPGPHNAHLLNGKTKKKSSNKKSHSMPSPATSNFPELPRSNSLQLPTASASVNISVKDHHHHPLKSPLPSPLASPIPSPTRSRFRVSRVCLGETAEITVGSGSNGEPREVSTNRGSSCSSSSSDEELCFGKICHGVPSVPTPTRKFKFTVTPVKTVNGVAQSPPNEQVVDAVIEREIWHPEPVWTSGIQDLVKEPEKEAENDGNLAGGCDRDSGIYLLEASGDGDSEVETEPKRPEIEDQHEDNGTIEALLDQSVPRESCSSEDSALDKDEDMGVCYTLVDIGTPAQIFEGPPTTMMVVRVATSDLLTGDSREDVFGPVTGEHDDLMLFTELTMLDAVDSKGGWRLLDCNKVLRRDSCLIEVLGDSKPNCAEDALFNENEDELSLASTGSS